MRSKPFKNVNTDQHSMVGAAGLDHRLPEHEVVVHRTRKVEVIVHETCVLKVRAPSNGEASEIAEATLNANHQYLVWMEAQPLSVGPNDGEVVDMRVGPAHEV